MSRINLAIIGCGTVGSGVIKILAQNQALIKHKLGLEFNLKYVVDVKPPTGLDEKLFPDTRFSERVDPVMADPEVDIVIHLIGGDHPEKEFILRSLEKGKQVVTANKALLAQAGPEIFQKALDNNCQIGYEASVAGGIPVLKVLKEGLVANRIKAIYGIINGTANYILTSMQEKDYSFSEALAEAKNKGYAETDSTFDVKGIDSAHKITILAELAYGGLVDFDQVYTEGIERITVNDLHYAREFGFTVKLLGIARMHEGKLDVRVHPSLIPLTHLLTEVKGVYNAVYIEGDMVGPTIYYGQGAGREPAASAVMADVIEISQRLKHSGENSTNVNILNYFCQRSLDMLDMENNNMGYYIRFMTIDQPGVLAQISGALGNHGISISAVLQKERHAGDVVPIVMMTHIAPEREVVAALAEVERLAVVKETPLKIRVISELGGGMK